MLFHASSKCEKSHTSITSSSSNGLSNPEASSATVE
jgi:hypothetical protein